jgi:chemotaxis protein MotB
MASFARRRRTELNLWPGFVDAVSSLVIILIFLVMVFMLSQYFLNELLVGRNDALSRLNRQVAELAEMLSFERRSSADLRQSLTQLSGELQSSIAARDRMSSELAELLPERDRLRARLDETTARSDRLSRELEDANKAIVADRATIELKLREIASLERDLLALRSVRTELESKVADLAKTLKARDEELTTARDRSKELVAQLSTSEERTALAQREIQEQTVRLRELIGRLSENEAALGKERALSVDAQRQVDTLNRQLTALRQELARLNAVLEASEAKSQEQSVQIVDLGRRLNSALASKVEELARYRSEFFGRLREVLGDRPDIRVVGDRFVFQSEVLFPSGSADLQDSGRDQIERLAQTLSEVAAKIPSDIQWVLRVDGHTDRVPISTARFPSNWELSTGRAIAVVKLLHERGIPSSRLAATGFGEYQPLDPGNDAAAYQRNRRIEFKLTER